MRFFARAFLLVGLIATAILFHESVQAQSSDSDHNATSTAESSPTKAAPEPESEEERIKAGTAEESRRIVESAQQEIAAATKAARRELTAYAADLAVTLASRQMKVDATTDQALVRRFAQQLSGDDGAKRN